MKKCGKCKLVLPMEHFARNKSKKDGLHDWCKKCAAENARKWRLNNLERNRASSKRWVQLNRQKSNAIKARWAKAHYAQVLAMSRRYKRLHPEGEMEAQRARRFIKKNILPWFQETGRTIQKPQKTQECASCGVLTLPSGLLIFDGQTLCCWCINDLRLTQAELPEELMTYDQLFEKYQKLTAFDEEIKLRKIGQCKSFVCDICETKNSYTGGFHFNGERLCLKCINEYLEEYSSELNKNICSKCGRIAKDIRGGFCVDCLINQGRSHIVGNYSWTNPVGSI